MDYIQKTGLISSDGFYKNDTLNGLFRVYDYEVGEVRVSEYDMGVVIDSYIVEF